VCDPHPLQGQLCRSTHRSNLGTLPTVKPGTVFKKVKGPGLVEKQRRMRRLELRVGPQHSLRTSGSCAQLSATSRRTEPLRRSTGSRAQRIVAATAVQLSCSWTRRPSNSLRALQLVTRHTVTEGGVTHRWLALVDHMRACKREQWRGFLSLV